MTYSHWAFLKRFFGEIHIGCKFPSVMKTCFIAFFLVFSVLFSACGENDPDSPTPQLSVTPLALDFSADGGSTVISITSNTTWQISSDASWCTADKQTSKGDANVTITAKANTLEEERTASITIVAENYIGSTVSVTQEPKEADTTTTTDPDYIEPDNTNMRDMTSLELSQLMGAGWNLGNTLEAIVVNGDNLSGGETSWGNPRASQQLIDSVKAAGFNSVRIPVAWSHKLEDQTSYKIKLEWLQRVEEVVNYVLSNDMYAIINVHWDGGWSDHPDYAHQDEINEKLDALWRQIAVYFRGYDDHLLFAGTNEVHVEGDYGNPSSENVDVQNSFNQTFVDAVRATGGRNHYRHLVVQGYNTNIDHTVNHFVLPEDEIENRQFVEVHFYDPYDFTLQTDGNYHTQWGKDFVGGDVSTWGQEAWVDEAFGKMKSNFVDKGIPVILGEYGANRRSSLNGGLEEHLAARAYYLEYVTHAAVSNNMIPFYWDNGNDSNTTMAIFNRNTGEQTDKRAVQAIINGAK